MAKKKKDFLDTLPIVHTILFGMLQHASSNFVLIQVANAVDHIGLTHWLYMVKCSFWLFSSL